MKSNRIAGLVNATLRDLAKFYAKQIEERQKSAKEYFRRKAENKKRCRGPK